MKERQLGIILANLFILFSFIVEERFNNFFIIFGAVWLVYAVIMGLFEK